MYRLLHPPSSRVASVDGRQDVTPEEPRGKQPLVGEIDNNKALRFSERASRAMAGSGARFPSSSRTCGTGLHLEPADHGSTVEEIGYILLKQRVSRADASCLTVRHYFR